MLAFDSFGIKDGILKKKLVAVDVAPPASYLPMTTNSIPIDGWHFGTIIGYVWLEKNTKKKKIIKENDFFIFGFTIIFF